MSHRNLYDRFLRIVTQATLNGQDRARRQAGKAGTQAGRQAARGRRWRSARRKILGIAPRLATWRVSLLASVVVVHAKRWSVGGWECGGGYNLPSHGPDQNIQNNAIAKREMSDGISKTDTVQPAVIGWPTGNGKKLSNSQACCLAKLCLAGA